MTRRYYNAGLSEFFGSSIFPRKSDEDSFHGVNFDLRGCIQLDGAGIRRHGWTYPSEVMGIKVDLACRRLHFLHATRWTAKEGQEIGRFVIHYASPHPSQTNSIVYGHTVRDYNVTLDPRHELTSGIEIAIKKVRNDSTRLFYRVNGGAYEAATGTTNWSGSVSLMPGTNFVEVTSVDPSENTSIPVSRDIYYEVNSLLTLEITGNGSVTPNLNGSVIKVGQTYRFTATPAANQLFVGWFRRCLFDK